MFQWVSNVSWLVYERGFSFLIGRCKNRDMLIGCCKNRDMLVRSIRALPSFIRALFATLVMVVVFCWS